MGRRPFHLKNYDIFALPVSLRYKGETHFKNSIGGCFTCIYLVTCAFLTCVMLKALFVGYYINASSTTYNLL